MIKVLLNYYIYDRCIKLLFKTLSSNFVHHDDIIFEEGNEFKTLIIREKGANSIYNQVTIVETFQFNGSECINFSFDKSNFYIGQKCVDKNEIVDYTI